MDQDLFDSYLRKLGMAPTPITEPLFLNYAERDMTLCFVKHNGRTLAKLAYQRYLEEQHMNQPITIKKSPNADSRTAKEGFTLDELEISTLNHISDVEKALLRFEIMLSQAGSMHDWTKKAYLEEFYSAMMTHEPGEDFKNGPWYQMHINRERHHLLSKAPDDVNLLDVLEYIADCVMAGLARSGEVSNVDIPDVLLKVAFNNTVELLKRQVVVEGEV